MSMANLSKFSSFAFQHIFNLICQCLSQFFKIIIIFRLVLPTETIANTKWENNKPCRFLQNPSPVALPCLYSGEEGQVPPTLARRRRMVLTVALRGSNRIWWRLLHNFRNNILVFKQIKTGLDLNEILTLIFIDFKIRYLYVWHSGSSAN